MKVLPPDVTVTNLPLAEWWYDHGHPDRSEALRLAREMAEAGCNAHWIRRLVRATIDGRRESGT